MAFWGVALTDRCSLAPSPGFLYTRQRPSLSPLTRCVLALAAGRHGTSTSRCVVCARARDWGMAKTDNGDKSPPSESKLLPGLVAWHRVPVLCIYAMRWHGASSRAAARKGLAGSGATIRLASHPTTPPRRHMLRRDALPTGFITSLSLLFQDDRQRRPSPLPRFPSCPAV